LRIATAAAGGPSGNHRRDYVWGVTRLRAGIRIDAASTPAWVARALEKISQHVDVAVLVGLPVPDHTFPYRLYARADRRFLGLGNDPRRPTDAPISTTKVAWVATERDAVATLRDSQVDFVIDLCLDEGSRLPPLASCPSWFVSLGRPPITDLRALRRNRERIFAVEILERRLGEEESVLDSSMTAIDPVSLARTVDPALWKAATMLERCTRRLAAGELSPLATRPARTVAAGHGAASAAALCATAAGRIARRRARKLLGRDEWFLAIGPADPRSGDVTATQFHPLEQAENGYRADPFLFERGGVTHLFFEEYSYQRRLGHLAVATVDDAGRLGPARACFAPDFHVSYPFVFEHDGETYLLQIGRASCRERV